MEGSTAANAPMPMIQQRDASQDRRWGSLHEPANIAVPKRSFGEISDPSQSWAKNRSVTLAPRPQDSMALTAWSMLLVVDGTCKVPACSDDKECSREISKQIRRCAPNILGHEDRLEIWSKMSGIGQLEADTATIIIQGNCHPHYTRKRDGFEPLRFTEYLHVVGHEQKAPLYPQCPCHFIFDRCNTWEVMTAASSYFMLPLPGVARWQGSFHIIRFWFYHLKSCSIRKLGPKVAPMAGDDGLWRPRCQSFPAPPLSRPASAPCLRAEKVVSPTRSTRSTRSLLRKRRLQRVGRSDLQTSVRCQNLTPIEIGQDT